MLKRLAPLLVLTITLGAPTASAQDCRQCARMSSQSACVACAVRAGYTKDQSRNWCARNQPACSKAAAAKRRSEKNQ
jgi:hypothetical protein